MRLKAFASFWGALRSQSFVSIEQSGSASYGSSWQASSNDTGSSTHSNYRSISLSLLRGHCYCLSPYFSLPCFCIPSSAFLLAACDIKKCPAVEMHVPPSSTMHVFTACPLTTSARTMTNAFCKRWPPRARRGQFPNSECHMLEIFLQSPNLDLTAKPLHYSRHVCSLLQSQIGQKYCRTIGGPKD